MNNEHLKKKSKMVHVQQDFFQQILNGFANEKQKVDASSSAIIIPSVQQTYFRKKTLPLILAADEKQGLLRRYFQHYYQNFLKEKKKQTVGLGLCVSLLFVRIKDDYQIQQQENKGGVLKNLITVGKTYQRIKRLIRVIRAARDLKQYIRQKIRQTNVSGNNEYLQAGLYRILGESQDQLQKSLENILFPFFMQFSRMIHTKVNEYIRSFFFYIVKRIFLPDLSDPVDTVLWFGGVVTSVLAIPSGGASLGGTAAIVATRLGAILRKLAVISMRIATKMNMVTVRMAGRMAMRATLAGGRMAVRGAGFLIRGGVNDNLVRDVRRYYRLLKFGTLAYTGIDLFNTDEGDVKAMTQMYEKRSSGWQQKVTRALTGRLRKIGEDMQMIENHFREIAEDACDSFVTSITSGGTLKVLSRKYKTSLRLIIVGENNNLTKVFKTLSNVQGHFKSFGGDGKKRIGDVFSSTSRIIKNDAQQTYNNLLKSLVIDQGSTTTFIGYNGSFEQAFKKTIQGEEITFEKNGKKLSGIPVHTMKAFRQMGHDNDRRDLTYDEDAGVSTINYLTTSRAITGLQLYFNNTYGDFNVKNFSRFYQNGKETIVSRDSGVIRGKKFFIAEHLYLEFGDYYKYTGSGKTNRYDADHNRIGSVNDKVSANGLYLWDFFLYQQFEENLLLKEEKMFTDNVSKIKNIFIEGITIEN